MTKIPQPKKISHTMEHHGHTRDDMYYWMRDDTRSDPEIIAHLEAENAYQEDIMSHTQPLQKELLKELKLRIKEDDESVPFKDGDFEYWFVYTAAQEHPVYYRASVKNGQRTSEPEVVFNPNLYAEKDAFYQSLEPDMNYQATQFAVAEDLAGRGLFQIRFYDLQEQKFLKDTLESTTGNVLWLQEGQAIVYGRKDPQTLLGDKIYLHRLGTSQKEDVLIYKEDKSYYTYLETSDDKTELYIVHDSTESSYASLIAADGLTVKPLLPNDEDVKHYVHKSDDRYLIYTNWQAVNYRIMQANPSDIGDKSKWQNIIPHREDVLLESFTQIQDYLIYIQSHEAQQQGFIYDLKQKVAREIPCDEAIYSLEIGNNRDIDADFVRVTYSSLTTPRSVYDVDLATVQMTQRKQSFSGDDFDAKHYQSERLWVDARDGIKVPVSLVYHKDHYKPGTNPLHIYGYGAYGFTIQPTFSSTQLSLLNRGFVMAIAHVRGSDMLGREWYYQGRQQQKKNSFNDFVDVTKALVAQGYGHPDLVFAEGGSAGGLLMGAVINQAPELYKGVIADVPFVDVVTTMLDESLPLTTNEYDEWGNPNIKEDYDYILSYSPYDQIKQQAYPNLLVKTGFHDSQVQYFEPAKWVAKLRDYHTGDAKILFQVNMKAGHSGDAGRYEHLKEVALSFSFFMDLVR